MKLAARWPVHRWHHALLLLIGLASILAPAFTGEEAYVRGSLFSRTLAVLVVFVSLWMLSGGDNFLPEMLSAVLGTGFVAAAYCTHCVEAHRATSLTAGIVVILVSLVAAALSLAEQPCDGTASAENRSSIDVASRSGLLRLSAFNEEARRTTASGLRTRWRAIDSVSSWNSATWN